MVKQRLTRGLMIPRLWMLLMAVFGINAKAGTATGLVTEIHVANHSRLFAFGVDTPIKDTPRCNEAGQFAVDLGKPGGEAILELLLAAKRDNRTVFVEGLNTCGIEWKSENVKSAILK
jgi:hypothetical protein